MKQIMITLGQFARAGVITFMALAASMFALADKHEESQADVEAGGRVMALEVEAVITAIDLETREVTLQGPAGGIFTLYSQDKVVKLEDVNVGDSVIVSYLAALESELREPTPAELATPWVEVEEEVLSDDAAQPGIADVRTIRAVVSVEAINSESGSVTIKDSRGKLHIIDGVEPEKMERIKVGQTAVMVFTQAVALTLQKKEEGAE
jgi:hypothetical protein